MITLLICSVRPELLARMHEQAEKNLGLPFEILSVDNRVSPKGLCEVYNSLAEKANYPILVFLHEDIIIDTPRWGQRLMDIFAGNPRAGLIGVAGSRYKSAAVSGWYSGFTDRNCYQIIHRDNGKDIALQNPPVWHSHEQEVVTLDGVFIACRREVWEATRFNQALLKGFHFYDLDFSFRASRSHTIVVTDRIRIIHETTGGDFSKAWLNDALKWHQYVAHQLPAWTGSPGNPDEETETSRYWCDYLKNSKISLQDKISFIRQAHMLSKPGLWYSIAKLLLFSPLGGRFLLHALRTFKKPRNSHA